jgi:hypothetical protein
MMCSSFVALDGLLMVQVPGVIQAQLLVRMTAPFLC